MLIHSEAVERAEAALEATDDGEAGEALDALLSAYKNLHNSHNYLAAGGEVEPWPPPRPLDELDPLEALPRRWRDEADTLRGYGAEGQAETLERCAEEVEDRVAARELESVTLEEASEIGGYSYSHLQHLVADGTLPNVGREGAPRIRRGDVPRKPGHGAESVGPTSSVEEWLASAVESA